MHLDLSLQPHRAASEISSSSLASRKENEDCMTQSCVIYYLCQEPHRSSATVISWTPAWFFVISIVFVSSASSIFFFSSQKGLLSTVPMIRGWREKKRNIVNGNCRHCCFLWFSIKWVPRRPWEYSTTFLEGNLYKLHGNSPFIYDDWRNDNLTLLKKH